MKYYVRFAVGEKQYKELYFETTNDGQAFHIVMGIIKICRPSRGMNYEMTNLTEKRKMVEF